MSKFEGMKEILMDLYVTVIAITLIISCIFALNAVMNVIRVLTIEWVKLSNQIKKKKTSVYWAFNIHSQTIPGISNFPIYPAVFLAMVVFELTNKAY